MRTASTRNLEVPSGNAVGTARAIAHAYCIFATGGHELGLRQETLDLLAAPAIPPTRGFYDECMKSSGVRFSLGFMKPSAASSQYRRKSGHLSFESTCESRRAAGSTSRSPSARRFRTSKRSPDAILYIGSNPHEANCRIGNPENRASQNTRTPSEQESDRWIGSEDFTAGL